MSIHVQVCAKTNLYLAITGRRADGYHDIETMFQNISLCDELQIEPARKFSLAITTEPELPPLEPGPDNLVLIAARALRELAQAPIPGARFHLIKRIPHGAGLGGGSADAAAALRGLNALYSLRLSNDQLYHAAIEVGMDVPFFLKGGTARAVGRGEQLEPQANALDPRLIVVYPDFPISTRRAYETWQRHRDKLAGRPGIGAMAAALASGDYDAFCGAVHNDFECLLAEEYPRIAQVKAELLRAGCDAAWLSGSGSAMIGAARDDEQAGRAAAQLNPGGYRFVKMARFTGEAMNIRHGE